MSEVGVVKGFEGVPFVERAIGKKLLLSVLLISTVVTTTLTSVSFYIDYKSELSSLDAQYEDAKKSFVNSLTQSLWDYDTTQLRVQADGILSNESFLRLQIRDKSGRVTFTRERPAAATTHDGEFKLLGSFANQTIKTIELRYRDQSLGALDLTITKDAMYRRLQDRLVSTFIVQLLKTLIVSISLLAVFNSLLTKRIIRIFKFLSKVDVTNPTTREELVLATRKGHKKDELDYLGLTVNGFVKMVTEHYEAKDRELNIQKAHALHSAKMASLGEMAGGIAHEINNPLGVLRTNNQLIDATARSEVIDGKEVLELTEASGRVIERIAKIVKGLRTIARDSSKDPWTDVTVASILDEISGLCMEKFKTHGVPLIIEVQEEAKNLPIHCSAVQISQVFINLINNAYDAIQGNAQKWVRVEVQHDTSAKKMVIKIIDSGLGIPAHVQEKLFTPFFTTKEVGKGTGLGLSISRSIVELHHGTLLIDDNSPNTCFVLTLPLAAASQKAA